MSKNRRGDRSLNGKPPLSNSRVGSPIEICRKLEDIHRDLALLGEQGKTKGFFNNVENADKLGGLVEDIRDAVMDYQVCISYTVAFPVLRFTVDIIATRHIQQELPAHR